MNNLNCPFDNIGYDLIYNISMYLDMNNLHIFSQVCKSFNLHKVDIMDTAYLKTDNCLRNLYNIMTDEDTRKLNTSAIFIFNRVPFTKTILDKYNIYNNLVKHILYKCDHYYLYNNNNANICEICYTIYEQYKLNNNKKTFINMKLETSWLSSIVMNLYH
jgi:hypothetical protein